MATRAKRRSAKPKRLTKKDLNAMYRNMLRIRRFEETTDEFFMAGRVKGAVHVSIGQEACSVGVCTALNDEDAILTTHRGHGHSIAKGTRMPEMMAELAWQVHRVSARPEAAPCTSPTSRRATTARTPSWGPTCRWPRAWASPISSRARAGWRWSFLETAPRTRGAFHESMNLCSIWKLPVIFFCENNHYAVSYHVERSTSVKDISVRAQGYNAPGVTVDGMDVVAVYEATAEAVRRARDGGGPSLIEAKTYRFFGHSRGDPQYGPYRTKEEVDGWRKRDPLTLAAGMLKLTEAQKKAHLKAVDDELNDAIAFAEQSPEATLESALEDVYA